MQGKGEVPQHGGLRQKTCPRCNGKGWIRVTLERQLHVAGAAPRIPLLRGGAHSSPSCKTSARRCQATLSRRVASHVNYCARASRRHKPLGVGEKEKGRPEGKGRPCRITTRETRRRGRGLDD